MFFLIALVQPILSIQSEYTSTCEDYEEKIDAVFTWVNGSDPWFMKGKVYIQASWMKNRFYVNHWVELAKHTDSGEKLEQSTKPSSTNVRYVGKQIVCWEMDQ